MRRPARRTPGSYLQEPQQLSYYLRTESNWTPRPRAWEQPQGSAQAMDVMYMDRAQGHTRGICPQNPPVALHTKEIGVSSKLQDIG